MAEREHTLIGRAERIDFPKIGLVRVPARIDTGAKTSAVWASEVAEIDGVLSFQLFAPGSPFYTGEVLHTHDYKIMMVATSTGEVQQRYGVKLVIRLHGRVIRATFTLANRASQVYPVLVGRNVLRGKFIVNVKLGRPLVVRERQREVVKRQVIKRRNTQHHRKENRL